MNYIKYGFDDLIDIVFKKVDIGWLTDNNFKENIIDALKFIYNYYNVSIGNIFNINMANKLIEFNGTNIISDEKNNIMITPEPENLLLPLWNPPSSYKYVIINSSPSQNSTGRGFEHKEYNTDSMLAFYAILTHFNFVPYVPDQLMTLKYLEDQGVLFLNIDFTAEVGKPNNHHKYWNRFKTHPIAELLKNKNIEYGLGFGEDATSLVKKLGIKSNYDTNNVLSTRILSSIVNKDNFMNKKSLFDIKWDFVNKNIYFVYKDNIIYTYWINNKYCFEESNIDIIDKNNDIIVMSIDLPIILRNKYLDYNIKLIKKSNAIYSLFYIYTKKQPCV